MNGTYPKRNVSSVKALKSNGKLENRFKVLKRSKNREVKCRKMAVEIVSQYLFDGRANKVLRLSFSFVFSYQIFQYSVECVSLQCDVTFMNEYESNGQMELKWSESDEEKNNNNIWTESSAQAIWSSCLNFMSILHETQPTKLMATSHFDISIN